jgi:predicted DNA-binding transcriptional regulator YafY
MAQDTKIKAIFKLMEMFIEQKTISKDDPYILESMGCSSRTIQRYLNEISTIYNHIITIKQNGKNSWHLVGVSDIFEEFIKNDFEISYLFELAREFDPDIFKELEKGTLSDLAKDENIFLFKNYIMEELKTPKSQQIFRNLKSAIRNREYRDIIYSYKDTKHYKDVKCLKYIFIDNNWYLASVIDGEFRLLRISFIDEVKYSKRDTFNFKGLEVYIDFCKTLQNSMSLYGATPKIATIEASKRVAIYFDKEMKKFLSSQKFIEKTNDGKVIFTLEYTQSLEILPFIKRWLPELKILSPKSLNDELIKDILRYTK